MALLNLTQTTFDQEIATGTTLVCFSSPSCGPCRSQKELLDSVATDALVATVNVEEEVRLAMRYGVRSLPTLALFRDGDLRSTAIGFQPLMRIKEILR